MANPYVMDEPDKFGATEQDEHCARLVLAVYTAVMASSRNEQSAFNAAVQTYRSENSDLPEDGVRRAVAQIICRKP